METKINEKAVSLIYKIHEQDNKKFPNDVPIVTLSNF